MDRENDDLDWSRRDPDSFRDERPRREMDDWSRRDPTSFREDERPRPMRDDGDWSRKAPTELASEERPRRRVDRDDNDWSRKDPASLHGSGPRRTSDRDRSSGRAPSGADDDRDWSRKDPSELKKMDATGKEERKKLILKPRSASKNVDNSSDSKSLSAEKSKPSPFGSAKPVDTHLQKKFEERKKSETSTDRPAPLAEHGSRESKKSASKADESDNWRRGGAVVGKNDGRAGKKPQQPTKKASEKKAVNKFDLLENEEE